MVRLFRSSTLHELVPMIAALVVGQAITHMPQAAALNQVGDTVCVEGFVMDTFCIERGTLLDRKDVVSLEGPNLHSYHCLLDVRSCVSTVYEVLVNPPSGESTYCRGWRTDDATKETLIAAARAEGERGYCETCTGAQGSPTEGYRATIRGAIIEAATNTSAALISGTEILSQTDNDVGYGCPEGLTMPDECLTAGAGGLTTKFYAHGSLMLIGWGFLLPAGVITARLFRHRPDGLWFKMHRILQISGLLFALAGFIIALTNFKVFGKEARGKGAETYVHGCLGATVMTIGLAQPLNAFIRPHVPEAGAEKTKFRVAWEIWHKGLGYIGVMLSVVTIGYGTTLLPTENAQRQFQMAYGIGCGVLWLIMSIGMVYDKKAYAAKEENAKGDTEKGAEDGNDERQAENEE